jgi:hypothetical protein
MFAPQLLIKKRPRVRCILFQSHLKANMAAKGDSFALWVPSNGSKSPVRLELMMLLLQVELLLQLSVNALRARQGPPAHKEVLSKVHLPPKRTASLGTTVQREPFMIASILALEGLTLLLLASPENRTAPHAQQVAFVFLVQEGLTSARVGTIASRALPTMRTPLVLVATTAGLTTTIGLLDLLLLRNARVVQQDISAKITL